MKNKIMKNKIIKIGLMGIFFVYIILLCNTNMKVYAKNTPEELKNIYAQSAVLIDADSGRILFGKNEKDVLPMASTTKIMTCILALENMMEKQICTVSVHASKQPKVRMGVRSGERYYLKDLLYSLMLESHNDSAVIIAEAIGGSVEHFAAMMNQKAKDIGCTDTYFITPNGLDAKDSKGIHSTTAKDLALIMRYCIMHSPEKESFLEITQKNFYQFTELNGRRTVSCNNHNAFLKMMEGALSGKTGFTNDAGYCYVGALTRGERTFIVAILACGWPNNKGYKWKDTRKIMEYALNHYEYKNVSKKIILNAPIVENGFLKEYPFRVGLKADIMIAGKEHGIKALMRNNEEIDVKIICPNTLLAPVKKDSIIGSVFYMIDGHIIGKHYIINKKNVEKRTMKKIYGVIFRKFLC